MVNYLDIILLIILLWSAWKGYGKGLVISLASLAALILGVVAGIKLSGYVAGWLTNGFGWQAEWVNLVAFAITFLGVVIAVHFLARLLERSVKIVGLGWANKLLGAVFSLLKTGLILGILLIVFDVVNRKTEIVPEQLLADSLLTQPLMKLTGWVWPLLENLYNSV